MCLSSSPCDSSFKVPQKFVLVKIIDADSRLDGHRYVDDRPHRTHAIAESFRMRHQTSTVGTTLYKDLRPGSADS